MISPFVGIDKKDRNCRRGNYGLLGLFVFLHFEVAERNREHSCPLMLTPSTLKLLRPKISSTLKYNTIVE